MTRAAGLSSFALPTWTTANRPASPYLGQLGFNTTLGMTEAYNGSAWGVVGGVYGIDFVVVGGGGGSANRPGDAGEPYLGAGGAGGLVQLSGYAVSAGQSLAVVVGAGGAAQTTGSDSSFLSRIGYGGGRGGQGNPSPPTNGGSGGGGGGYFGATGGGVSIQISPLYGGY